MNVAQEFEASRPGKMRSTHVFLIAIATVFLLFQGGLRPLYNWDMVAYVATAHYKDGLRGKELSEQTYGEIRHEVGDAVFSDLTKSDDPYRATVFNDPKSLEQNIPFYSMRFFYVETIRAAKLFGLTYVQGSYIISAAAVALTILILFLIAVKTRVSPFMVPLIVFSSSIGVLARLSTPDALAGLAALLCIFAVLVESPLSLLLALFLPAVRTDLIILSALVTAYEFWSGRRLASSLALIGATAIYFGVNRLNGNYGWLTLFNFTFIKMTAYPADLPISSHPTDYLRPYYEMVLGLPGYTHFVVYILGLYALATRWKSVLSDRKAMALSVIPLLYVFGHLLLFPAYKIRFFSFAEDLMMLWLCSLLSPHVGAHRTSANSQAAQFTASIST